MKHLLYIIVACAFTACSHSNPEIKKRISGADSMAINYFKGDGTVDTVVAVKIIRDQKKIDALASLVAAHAIKGDYKCGYDGSLHFFKMDKVIQDIQFRMNAADCMYFFFVQDGRAEATELSQEAKDLINSFNKP